MVILGEYTLFFFRKKVGEYLLGVVNGGNVVQVTWKFPLTDAEVAEQGP